MLTACGFPQSGRGGGLPSTDRLTVSTAQGLYFRKDLAHRRSGVFVGCYVGMRAGIGRCYHRTQCEGICANSSTTRHVTRAGCMHTGWHVSVPCSTEGRAGTSMGGGCLGTPCCVQLEGETVLDV